MSREPSPRSRIEAMIPATARAAATAGELADRRASAPPGRSPRAAPASAQCHLRSERLSWLQFRGPHRHAAAPSRGVVEQVAVAAERVSSWTPARPGRRGSPAPPRVAPAREPARTRCRAGRAGRSRRGSTAAGRPPTRVATTGLPVREPELRDAGLAGRAVGENDGVRGAEKSRPPPRSRRSVADLDAVQQRPSRARRESRSGRDSSQKRPATTSLDVESRRRRARAPRVRGRGPCMAARRRKKSSRRPGIPSRRRSAAIASAVDRVQGQRPRSGDGMLRGGESRSRPRPQLGGLVRCVGHQQVGVPEHRARQRARSPATRSCGSTLWQITTRRCRRRVPEQPAVGRRHHRDAARAARARPRRTRVDAVERAAPRARVVPVEQKVGGIPCPADGGVSAI